MTVYKDFIFYPSGTVASVNTPRKQRNYRRIVARETGLRMSYGMWLIYFSQLRTPRKHKRTLNTSTCL